MPDLCSIKLEIIRGAIASPSLIWESGDWLPTATDLKHNQIVRAEMISMMESLSAAVEIQLYYCRARNVIRITFIAKPQMQINHRQFNSVRSAGAVQ